MGRSPASCVDFPTSMIVTTAFDTRGKKGEGDNKGKRGELGRGRLVHQRRLSIALSDRVEATHMDDTYDDAVGTKWYLRNRLWNRYAGAVYDKRWYYVNKSTCHERTGNIQSAE